MVGTGQAVKDQTLTFQEESQYLNKKQLSGWSSLCPILSLTTCRSALSENPDLLCSHDQHMMYDHTQPDQVTNPSQSREVQKCWKRQFFNMCDIHSHWKGFFPHRKNLSYIRSRSAHSDTISSAAQFVVHLSVSVCVRMHAWKISESSSLNIIGDWLKLVDTDYGSLCCLIPRVSFIWSL